MKQWLHWLVMHGVIRTVARGAARRGDPQARMAFDPAVRADPVPFFNEMRDRGPMIPTRVGFLTLDHAVAHELLRSDDFRVIILGGNLPKPLQWVERRTRDDLLHPLRPPSLLAVEPPAHTRYRKTVSSVFTTRAVAALRDRVEDSAIELLDGLSEGPRVVDIVERYCSQLPVAVIGDILGVPDADRPRILEFGELAAPSLDVGLSWSQYQRVQKGLAGFNEWLSAHLRHLREDPGDDLMSQLIAASEDGEHLDEPELQGIAGLVLAAGFETTVNLLGNGIRLLLNSPDQLVRLREDPSLWPSAVEEILRLESPVQLSARIALRDTVVAGATVRAGEMVAIYLAAANRDPAVFDDPHRFDVGRPNAGKHLAFSGGRHFCLGAALARAEGEVGLRRFFTHFPEVQLAGLGSRRDTRVLRGWAELPVSLGSPSSERPNRHFAEKV
ncbi:cytochrome P450 [Mycolicibacterium sphagni]|uniref:Cytochrome P450 n=1 Tax=Mycolicibacterium sphagni TaxID=1786 RepID=A0ABX2JUT2_9MYCO|nr:cytochrome P450 [Mycolicibacterium sphagni]NTY60532.1 cytochrome P450 [Mycolicibacterium sphagni]